MRYNEVRSTVTLAVLAVLLAVAVGVVIPLASGSRLGGRIQPTWTPPTPTPTAARQPTRNPTATRKAQLPASGAKTPTRPVPGATATQAASPAVTESAPPTPRALTSTPDGAPAGGAQGSPTVAAEKATLTPPAPAQPQSRRPAQPTCPAADSNLSDSAQPAAHPGRSGGFAHPARTARSACRAGCERVGFVPLAAERTAAGRRRLRSGRMGER